MNALPNSPEDKVGSTLRAIEAGMLGSIVGDTLGVPVEFTSMELQVDLTCYLVAQHQHADRLIRVDGEAMPQLHLHDN